MGGMKSWLNSEWYSSGNTSSRSWQDKTRQDTRSTNEHHSLVFIGSKTNHLQFQNWSSHDNSESEATVFLKYCLEPISWQKTRGENDAISLDTMVEHKLDWSGRVWWFPWSPKLCQSCLPLSCRWIRFSPKNMYGSGKPLKSTSSPMAYDLLRAGWDCMLQSRASGRSWGCWECNWFRRLTCASSSSESNDHLDIDWRGIEFDDILMMMMGRTDCDETLAVWLWWGDEDKNGWRCRIRAYNISNSRWKSGL